MGVGRLVTRATVGALFIGHGTQKLLGWFGGGGPAGTGEMFEQAGLAPGRGQAVLAGTAEAAGGALLLAGLATPLATASLSTVMLTAIRTVHWEKGPWSTDGGYEYPLVMLASLFGLAEAGPGRISVDAVRGRQRHGLRWALAQLAAAAIGSQLAVAIGRKVAAARTQPATPESPQWADTARRSWQRAA